MPDTTTLAPHSYIEGDIQGSGELIVEGTLSGEVDLSDSLVIEESGYVEGEIHAEDIVIKGDVKGVIRVEGRAEIYESARVLADIHTGILRVEQGARISGDIETGLNETSSSQSSTRSTSSSRSTSHSSSRKRRSSKSRDEARPASDQKSDTEATEPEDDSDSNESESVSEQSQPGTSVDELESKTKEQLKRICRKNGLKVSGRKAELVKRIRENVHETVSAS